MVKSFLGNPFDFNGDGKTDMVESLLAFKIFEECTKEDESSAVEGLDFQEDPDWRETCEDGDAYGLDSEDFDSPEEYQEALDEAEWS